MSRFEDAIPCCLVDAECQGELSFRHGAAFLAICITPCILPLSVSSDGPTLRRSLLDYSCCGPDMKAISFEWHPLYMFGLEICLRLLQVSWVPNSMGSSQRPVAVPMAFLGQTFRNLKTTSGHRRVGAVMFRFVGCARLPRSGPNRISQANYSANRSLTGRQALVIPCNT